MGQQNDNLNEWPAGLPVEYPCISFWLATTRGFAHLTEGAGEPLPAHATTVVIGSGIAGSLAAYQLLADGAKDVVMLEARDAASCASARNGGHVRPNPFYGFARYSTVHGVDQALKIIANERVVLEDVAKFVHEHQVDCDFERLSSFHTILNDEHVAELEKIYEAYKSAGGPVEHIKIHKGAEAAKITRVPQAVAAWEFPAATVHPAKLTQYLVSSNIKNGLKVFTHTPALAVEQAPDGSGNWIIKTSRGSIATTRVLHATNAFAPVLLPEFKGCIIPNKAQCLALVPSPSYAGARRLTHSQAYEQSWLRDWYSIQRKTDAVIIMGISRDDPEFDEETRRLIIEERAIDRRPVPGMVRAAIKAWHELHPDFGKPEDLAPGEGLQLAWSGVVGSTTDSVPFVGEVPGKPGQWICAGLGGHGMARLWTAAPAVAKLMNGAAWEDTGIPECFNLTAKRLARAQNLARVKTGPAEVV